jgi:DNA-binding CsgD family transcriptional regulator/Flp pilus assembly protein TadD
MVTPFGKSAVCPVLIGRASYLASILQCFEQARDGHGQVLLLAGEAGIGKSRLVAEARVHAAQAGMGIFEGRCFEPDRTLPYAPVLDLLRAYFSARTPEELAREIDPSAQELVKLLPELAAFFPNITPTPSLEPEQEKHRLIQTLASFFARRASPRPLLIVVEDLHWSDEASLEFLLSLARRVVSTPIFLLMTYRSEETSPVLGRFLATLDRERRAEELTLPLLTREQVREMIHSIFEQPHPARAEFVDAIFALTEGNPFFIEEILKSLVASGDIYYSEGVWTRKPMSELHIPRSAQDAVQRRSAQLSSEAREALAIAAVAGRRFDFTLLQQLTRRGEDELLTLLKELIAAQLIVEETAEQFAFRHALTRQAVYASLLARERQTLHRNVAEMMERLYTESLDGHTTDLAYHFYEAGDWAKALEYLQHAGEKAQAMFAPRAAVEHFTRALEAAHHLTDSPTLGGEETVLRLLRARGLAYATLGEFDSARADHETALKLAQEGGDRHAEWQALLDLGLLWSERDYSQSGDHCQRALELARAMGDPSTLAQSLNRVGNWRMNSGQPSEAVRYHQEALGIFQELNDRRGLAQTCDLLGMATMQCGDLIQSRAYYQQAVTLFEALNDRQGLASSLTSLAFIGGTFHFGEAERAVQVAREIGWRSGEAYALIMLGGGLGLLGDYARALDLIQSGLVITEEIEHREWMTAGHCYLGMLYLDLLAVPLAQEHLGRALTLAQEINSGYWIQSAAMRLVQLHSAQGNLPQAQTIFESAFGSGEAIESIGPLALLAQGELALAEGNGELALQCVERVIAFLANASDNLMMPQLLKQRGEVLLLLRRYDEAETILLASQKEAEIHRLRPLLWRIHLTLGNLYYTRTRRVEAEMEFAAARTIIEELSASILDLELRDQFIRRAAEMLPPAPKATPLRIAKKEFGGLTAREREVSALIAQGKSNREIAETLVVGERTVEAHVGSILSKLGFTSRAQVAVWAVEKGLK